MSHTRNPWTTLASRLIYENPWLRIREDQVLTPAGTEGIYGLVKFRNRAIGIIPVDNDGYTWLVGQYRYALSAYSWEIPMGGQPLQEEPQDGALRELREETGLRAQSLTELMRLHTSNSVTDEEGIVYLAQQLTEGETEFEDTEELVIRRLPLSDAIDWVMTGKITDAISVAGLLKLNMLRKGFGIPD